MNLDNRLTMLGLVATLVGSLVAFNVKVSNAEVRIQHAEDLLGERSSGVATVSQHSGQIAVLTTEIRQLKEVQAMNTSVIQGINTRISAVEGNVIATNEILLSVKDVISDFNVTTKELTDVVIRLDERVKTLEKE